MDFEVWYDENVCVVKARILRSLTRETAEKLMSEIERMLVKMNARRGMMDLTSMGSAKGIPKEVREVYKEHSTKLPLDKAAILVDSPILRMTARVVLAALGKSNKAKFFKTEAEALSWLKGAKA